MSRLRRFIQLMPLLLFVASLCFFSFLYGVIAAEYELFPFHTIREAQVAATALAEVINEKMDQQESEAPKDDVAPASSRQTTVEDHGNPDDGALILVSGGPQFLIPVGGPGGCLAWLMNRSGAIQHVWKLDPELWSDLEHTTIVPGFTDFYPVDVHLLDDGGLIATFQSDTTFPFAIGMARFDRDSNLVWKKESHAHHWFQLTEDDRIVTPMLRVRKAPHPIGSTAAAIFSLNQQVYEDLVTVMTLDGEILEEISMLDVMHDSGLVGLYQGAQGKSEEINCHSSDPLHLNWVQLVGDDVAASVDWLNPDDLLVSFRSINSVAIIDRTTHLVKWISSGATLRQHCPIFDGPERLLVFDNLGGNPALGRTRLAEIRLDTRRSRTLFPRTKLPGDVPLESRYSGHLELNPRRRSVLMTVTCQSAVYEIDLETSEPVWEYHFADPHHSGKRDIHTAKFCYDVSFEMNQQPPAD